MRDEATIRAGLKFRWHEAMVLDPLLPDSAKVLGSYLMHRFDDELEIVISEFTIAVDLKWSSSTVKRAVKTLSTKYVSVGKARPCNAYRAEFTHVEASYLKPVDDPSSKKAMLSAPDGRVYREVLFLQSDIKGLWPKSLPSSGEPLVEHVEPDTEQTQLVRPRAKQSERTDRYIRKNYPKGTDGIPTGAIYDKLCKDQELQGELKKLGRTTPSPTTINRVLGRRVD